MSLFFYWNHFSATNNLSNTVNWLKFADNQENYDEDDSVYQVCFYCGLMPCDWEQFGHDLVEEVLEKYSKRADGAFVDRYFNIVPSNQIRKKVYKLYVWARYRKLGFQQRLKVPIWFESGIKGTFPDPDRAWMGFKEK